MKHTAATLTAERPGEVVKADSIRRMYCVDTSASPRIPILMELVGSVSRASSPQEIYRRFRDGINRLGGHDAYLALSTRGLEPGEYRVTHFDRRDVPESKDHDPWSHRHRIPILKGGFLGEIIRSAWPELIHNLDIQDDPAVGRLLAPYRSMLVVPIFDHGEPLNWAVMLSTRADYASIDLLEEAILRANLIGGMTKNAVISQQLRAANKRIEREMQQIANIQRSLLPDPLPTIHGVELAASYKTSEQAGGDYYDLLPLEFDENGKPDPKGRWLIIVADASGHGPSAAVVMAMLHTVLHAYPDHAHGPAEILNHVNRQLASKRIEGSFVTAFLAIYDPVERTLSYTRAGHNPPLVKEGGSIHQLDGAGGLPLGIEASWEYEATTHAIEPGQTVLFFTDGVTEAFDKDGQMFGSEGIEKALECCSGYPQCSVQSINESLEAHQKDSPIRDDQTLLVMRVNE